MAVTEVSYTQRLTGNYAKCGVIFVTWPDGTKTQGTCAVVGQNDILTAGHMVNNPDRGGWASDIDLYFGADYNNITDGFDSYSYSYSLTSNFKWNAISWPKKLYTDTDNKTLLSSESQYDIALIGVSKPIGDITGWFGLDPGLDSNLNAIEVGYPNTGTGMMTSNIAVSHNSYYNIYESIQDLMGPGSSGGPLFTSDGYIIGVKSGGNSTSQTWADIGNVYSYLTKALADNNSLLSNISDDYSASTATTGRVVIGGLTTGKIELVDDKDWFAVSLSASTTYKFSLGTQAGGLGDPMLNLRGPSGNLLLTDDDSGPSLDAEITYTAATGGTYFLEVLYSTSPYATASTTGSYSVSAITTSNKITGTTGYETRQGTTANDSINGGDGNDTLIGGAGNDSLYGGKGTDTAQYSGAYSNFTVTALYAGKNGAFSGYQVKDNTGAEGTDTISTDVEYLTFNNNQTKISLGSTGAITVVSNTATTNHAPTGSVAISGATKSGQVLTASNSLADTDGLGSITYQWQSSPDGVTWSNVSTGSSLTLSNAVVGLKLRVTASYTDALGAKESVFSSTTDAIQSAANVINGTSGNDNLIGTSAIDQISAGAGNDLITGSAGNDTIDGGVGVDTLTYAGTYGSFTAAKGGSGAFTLTSSNFGSDSVTNVERFKFSDKCFANDVSGAAGNAAKVITAAFGKAYVPQFLAIGLTLADSGQTIDNLCETVTNAKLVESIAGDSSTSGYVSVIFKNVVGRAPNVLESNSFVSMVDSGSISRLGLLQLAAKHSMVSDTVNSLNVELLGIAYDPGF